MAPVTHFPWVTHFVYKCQKGSGYLTHKCQQQLSAGPSRDQTNLTVFSPSSVTILSPPLPTERVEEVRLSIGITVRHQGWNTGVGDFLSTWWKVWLFVGVWMRKRVRPECSSSHPTQSGVTNKGNATFDLCARRDPTLDKPKKKLASKQILLSKIDMTNILSKYKWDLQGMKHKSVICHQNWWNNFFFFLFDDWKNILCLPSSIQLGRFHLKWTGHVTQCMSLPLIWNCD